MNAKLYALSGLALIVALAACILAATASTRALKKLQANITDSSGQVSLLSSRITRLEKQLKDISTALGDIQAAQERRAAASSRITIDETTPESLNDYLVSINDAMYQLEEIVDASGLKSIATNLAVDPSILKNLYDEQYRRKKETEYRNAMVQLNTAQHEADKADYGEEVKPLYEASRFQFGRRGRNQNQEEAEAAREKAMKELIEKYPNANATGMVIAENAMGSAFRGNFEDAEKYYSMLMETEKRSQVVTDWGMKAAPTMQYYLASQYIEKGRTQEAEDLIYQLEQCGDDMIFAAGQGRGGGRRWPGYQSTTDAVKDLRKQLEQK
jgi:outer membrane murein-binding lipoprotein Lpp